MTFNKIFVLGAGAVGSIYGALLSKKTDVTLIGNKAHADAINSNGLFLHGNFEGRYEAKADTEIKEIPDNSLILLTTKVIDSEKAIMGIKNLIKKDTVILLLQNGLGIEEQVRKILPNNEIIRGIITLGSDFIEPGKIANVVYKITEIEKSKSSEKITKLFNDCGLKFEVSDDIENPLWTKLILNCVLNALSTILHARDFEIVTDDLKPIRYGIADECIEVAKSEGINIDSNIKEIIDKKLSSLMNYSSMYQDIVKGKKTEIDFLNGKIVELGKKHNISTPLNEMMIASIKFLEGKNEYREN
jgi:2-dehydropantoate 2-reductase